MKIIDRIKMHLNESFSAKLKEAFEEKFEGVEIDTFWSIFAGRMVTNREDGQEFTPEQHSFIDGFSKAWLDATAVVLQAA